MLNFNQGRILQNQATAAKRRILFEAVANADGKTRLGGLSFSGAEIKVAKNFTEANFLGTVTELDASTVPAVGLYYCELTQAETDTLGLGWVRINKTGVEPRLYSYEVTDLPTEIWSVILAELAQATPAATPTALAALMTLYMGFRNQLTVTGTLKSVRNDAGTVIFKKVLSDDGTTYTEAKTIGGP